jgi:transcription-repair coupling factor (superfamily II helicase)
MSLDLSGLLPRLTQLTTFDELVARTGEQTSTERKEPMPRAARPWLVAGLARRLDRPILLLVARSDRLLTLSEELSAWEPNLTVRAVPEPNPLPYETSPWGPRTLRQRAALLADWTAGQQPGGPDPARLSPSVTLVSARGVMTRTVGPRTFLANSRWLPAGGHRRLDQLLAHLAEIGYAHSSIVAEPGQFSRRGGILDIWPPLCEQPARLEFFGDEIETLRAFDPASQRSGERLDGIRLTPAREGLPKSFDPAWRRWLPAEAGDEVSTTPEEHLLESFLSWMEPEPASLLDYLPAGALAVVDDRDALELAINELEEQAVGLRQDQISAGLLPAEAPIPYLTLGEIGDRLRERGAIDLGMTSLSPGVEGGIGDLFQPGPRFGGQLRPLLTHLASRQRAHEPVVVVTRQASRLAELWNERGSSVEVRTQLPANMTPGQLVFLQGALGEGWTLTDPANGRLHLLTDAELFGWARPQPRRRRRQRAEVPEASYADLFPGDLIVHMDYGIGRFAGLVERTLDGLLREYLLVEYAGNTQVYVPVYQADRVTKYVGVDGAAPDLSRLGTAEWDRVRSKAQQSAEDTARELLDLYAKRMLVEGHTYSPDTVWQKELEASFPYVETDDQMAAIDAVKSDMQARRPMDRLICGDVGYGKTEVALRAAFKAVMDNRQVALLVPTTILAQQHFHTFRQRLAAYPVQVEMLSRFRTPAETADILARLSTGEIDIVIGTHRLLQPDVNFRHLGLLIIDEEQRFGVTHKEFLKQMRTEVDVLTLTATPIPRTLYMALTGVRDISTIDTPPEERLPVITHVGRYDPRLVRQAILREIDRGGQVFFVHNRVQTIDRVRDLLGRLVPEARLVVAHGQMPERQLSSVMDRFSLGDVDVLVSTSIIESGLDIPNANTLIVDRADMFGLAQLYQLRGRVGRASVRAYAYFFREAQRQTTEEALQRLEVIAEHTQLGSGYSIALRDLELRGAGDILGTRQHGQIAAVGFHLYTRLLNTAVRRLRQVHEGLMPQAVPEDGGLPLDVAVELPLPSALPPDYVEDRGLRLQLYRRMAELKSLDLVAALREELADRFGPPPPEVDNLLYQLRVKVLAARAQVQAVTAENGQILLAFEREDNAPALLEAGDVRYSRRGLWLERQEDGAWTQRLVEVLEALARARASEGQLELSRTS